MFQYIYDILKTIKKFSISLTESHPRAVGKQSMLRDIPFIFVWVGFSGNFISYASNLPKDIIQFFVRRFLWA